MKLFLDDERDPIGDDWTIARTYAEACAIIQAHGLPSFISFDHDLGPDQRTGMDVANFIVDYCLDNDLNPTFDYYVHSQNPVGKANIEGLLTAFKQAGTL